MFNLIKKMSLNAKLSVCGEPHIVKTGTLYVTESNTENWYAKFVMEDHSVLVLSPFDNFAYYGRINNVFGEDENFKDTILFNGSKYVKEVET